jgi:hypothetical protein
MTRGNQPVTRSKGPAGRRGSRREGVSAQHGDFQTPPELAQVLCRGLAERGVEADLILEPTCGDGSFLIAAAQRYPRARALGLELSDEHLSRARAVVAAASLQGRVEVRQQDFFQLSFPSLLPSQETRVLVVGNPPWVTNAAMTRIGGENLPIKENLKNLSGFDAISGKSNFDISEWMILKMLEALQGRSATVAMLCKSAVARRILEEAARRGLGFSALGFWSIDARASFGVAVEAGFFVFRTEGEGRSSCPVFDSRGGRSGAFGVLDGELVACTETATRWQALRGRDGFTWRSGVKHDCAAVMVLRASDTGTLTNGLGERVDIEDEHLYPHLRATALRGGEVEEPLHRLIVTQRRVGESTAEIAESAPRTWRYLEHHRARFEARRSSIYTGAPPYSIFGVGPYAFLPWKVAISGLTKRLRFELIGPFQGKPVLLDDTSYFLGFDDESMAAAVLALLQRRPARELLGSSIFWDAKRPVTKSVLEQLHLGALARWVREQDEEVGLSEALLRRVEAAAECGSS